MTLPLVGLWCPEAASDFTICVLKSVALTFPPLGYLRTHKLSHGYICITHTSGRCGAVGQTGLLCAGVRLALWVCSSIDLYPLFPHISLAFFHSPLHFTSSWANAKGPSASRGPVASTKSLGPDVWSWPCVSLSMADLALAHWWTTSQLSLGDVVHGC